LIPLFVCLSLRRVLSLNYSRCCENTITLHKAHACPLSHAPNTSKTRPRERERESAMTAKTFKRGIGLPLCSDLHLISPTFPRSQAEESRDNDIPCLAIPLGVIRPINTGEPPRRRLQQHLDRAPKTNRNALAHNYQSGMSRPRRKQIQLLKNCSYVMSRKKSKEGKN
jgi:hypothetical protein